MKQNDILDIFTYKDGELFWKKHRSKSRLGIPAGHINKHNRYLRIAVRGRLYYIHRLIYVMFNGDTENCIDHIDRNTCNNTIENLRAVTHIENMQNASPYTGGTSRFKGVSKHAGGKWKASIRNSKKLIYLGLYVSEEEAALAYDRAAEVLFGAHAYLNNP